ncbi:hypothetical protein THIOSC15_320008 [uncultured Thiomicrorhabdus sp.]
MTIKLKTFNNPNSQKTKQIFEEFFDKDITQEWNWNNYEPKNAREILNKWISKRGEAVHRAETDIGKPHIVKREELIKCIKFFKGLANATDKSAMKL